VLLLGRDSPPGRVVGRSLEAASAARHTVRIGTPRAEASRRQSSYSGSAPMGAPSSPATFTRTDPNGVTTSVTDRASVVRAHDDTRTPSVVELRKNARFTASAFAGSTSADT